MQVTAEFEKLQEWEDIAKKLVVKYPERFDHVETSKLVCYVITNKDLTDNARPYEMQTDKLPMRLSNTFDYFVWFKHPSEWHDKPDNIKAALVFSALERIDPDKPFAIAPLDYRDQSVMVRTFGIDWMCQKDIPNMLDEKVEIRE